MTNQFLVTLFLMLSLDLPSDAGKSTFTNPWDISASFSKLTSFARGIPLVCICNTSSLPFLSGTPISISLNQIYQDASVLDSIALTLFVAPITTTFPLEDIPSINHKRMGNYPSLTSPDTSSLLGAIESISSMKIIEGAFFSACWNTFLSFSSDSP